MFNVDYAGLAIFDGLTAAQLGVLSPFLQEVHHPRGATFFVQGQIADCLFILLDGEVQVRYKPYDGPALTVARIFSGGVFGWSAILGHELYTSGAQAVKDCVAYRIRIRSLQRLIETYPEVGSILIERLASSIAERLRDTHTSVLEVLYQGVDPNGYSNSGS